MKCFILVKTAMLPWFRIFSNFSMMVFLFIQNLIDFITKQCQILRWWLVLIKETENIFDVSIHRCF